MRKKIIKITIKVTLIALLLFIIVVAIHILRLAIHIYSPMPEIKENNKEYMLEITPIGAKMDDVVKVIENNETWELGTIDRERGFFLDEEGTPGYIGDVEVGVKHIAVYIQTRTVDIPVIYYAFDENEELLDIRIGSVMNL